MLRIEGILLHPLAINSLLTVGVFGHRALRLRFVARGHGEIFKKNAHGVCKQV
jgi:hypothetical protein